MSIIKISIYTTSSKKEPFTDWLNKLDNHAQSVILERLARVRLGNFGDCKLLTKGLGVWELRIHHSSGYRVYFGKERNTIVILLLGGDKKSQNNDIEKAIKYWLAYKELNQ